MSDLVLARRYTMDNAYEAFDNLDVSEATRAEYVARLSPFINFIDNNQFNINTFLSFKRELRSRDDLATSTKNKYLVSARIFLKELHRRGILPTDITHNVRNFRLDKRHKVNGLNDEEVERLEVWCHRNNFDNYRGVAIMCLLFYQGLRSIEICNLNWEDIRWRSQSILIRGKGRDDKEPVWLHPVTMAALKKYHLYRHIYEIEDRPRGAVFRSRSVPSKRGRITTRGLRHIVKTAFAEVGIDKTVHGLRHTFVTRLVKYFKGDVTKVALFSRHRSLEMVMVYNNAVLEQEDLIGYMNAFNDVKLFVD